MNETAQEMLREMLHEQTIRVRAADETGAIEHERLRGLVLNCWRHGMAITDISKESGVSRQSIYAWIRLANKAR